ncbi:MAG: transcriptional regulator [Acidobacteria bacterium]|nr:MAG: transcriptional regulator [Acidobacteriota bacterium]
MRPVPAAPPSPVARCAALADETRWEVLRRLGQEPLSASELAETMPVSRQAIARHLGVLLEVGLVEQAREGRQVRYRALGQQLTRLARDLETVGRAWEQRLDRLRVMAEEQAGRDSSGG